MMAETPDKIYRETMEELMLVLKLGTNQFIKKVKEKSQKIEYDNLEIPITVSLKEDYVKFEKDVFGVGKPVQTNMMLTYPNPNLQKIRMINQNVAITEGISLLHGKIQFFKEEGTKKMEFRDFRYILLISKDVLNTGVNVNLVKDWIFEKMLKKDSKLTIKGREISNQEELQAILSDIIPNRSS